MLTDRQREILMFIENFILSNGFAPSVREIGSEFGIGSPHGVVCHLLALERKGFIFRTNGNSRSIVLNLENFARTCWGRFEIGAGLPA